MMTAGLLVAAIFMTPPDAERENPVLAHYRFENNESKNVEGDSASLASVSPGDLIGPTPRANRYSARFDGTTTIIHSEFGGDSAGLAEGFTWEGFFLSPASNVCETDGGIADRFISQFLGTAATSTRLTIGLCALKKGGVPNLAVAFGGTSALHAGRLPVEPDCWHHFALVHENGGADSKIRWYLDYEVCGEIILTGKSVRDTLKAPGSAPLAIGARLKNAGNVDRGFDGLLDEIRLIAAPLRPSQFLRVFEPHVVRNVTVDYFERLANDVGWDLNDIEPTESLSQEALSITGMPVHYSQRGFRARRWGRHAARASCSLTFKSGTYQFLIRAESDALLTMNGKTLIDARIPIAKHPLGKSERAQRDYFAELELAAGAYQFVLTSVVDFAAETSLGEVVVMHRQGKTGDWHLLGSTESAPVSPQAWAAYRGRTTKYWRAIEKDRRRAAVARGREFWKHRHNQIRERVVQWNTPSPPSNDHPIDAFLAQKMAALDVEPAPVVDDVAFLRRATLDVLGRNPSIAEIHAFANDKSSAKREHLIDRLLASDEYADGWVGYWQDVLAENPSILKPHLNNSGPFREWIRRSFRSNVAFDRFATELIMMEGSPGEGGTSGFAIAADNDLPSAMKAHVILKAFLAADLKCARCHDSPIEEFKQRDLFSAAALLKEGPITVPAASVVTIPAGGRVPSVTSSLESGAVIRPLWTLEQVAASPHHDRVPLRPRERLAQIITSPNNPRFAQVFVNRLWKRYLGAGLIEPVDEWSVSNAASHPELLDYLAAKFAESGYDVKRLVRKILASNAYQREVGPSATSPAAPEQRTFAAQHRRRLAAEQIVDSVFAAVGKGFDAEELNFDPAGTRDFLNLGTPRKAWQFASLSNERDRPALAMPVNQSIVDVLAAFGWRAARADPVTDRDESPNPLQPLMLANGVMLSRAIRLTEVCAATQWSLEATSVEALVDNLVKTTLGRRPDRVERAAFVDLLRPAFENRKTGRAKPKTTTRERARVDWDRHLLADATKEIQQAERLVRQGEPPTVRLTADFRERVEDMLWVLFNSPEFVFVP